MVNDRHHGGKGFHDDKYIFLMYLVSDLSPIRKSAHFHVLTYTYGRMCAGQQRKERR